jgi:hypothetical protein
LAATLTKKTFLYKRINIKLLGDHIPHVIGHVWIKRRLRKNQNHHFKWGADLIDFYNYHFRCFFLKLLTLGMEHMSAAV